MQPKVSIIIPLYNVEKYIRQCLDSIVKQTLKDIQIILVNDGSPDASGEICREYAAQYENVEYYEQTNGGSAKARNHGLDHAKGEYVGFIDADDWVDPDFCEGLYNAAKENNDADIVFCRTYEEETPGAYEYIFPRSGYYNREQMEKEIFPNMMPRVMPKGNFRSIRWCNWLRLYKKSIIDRYHIRSCENVSNCEDLGFNTEVTIHADSYYYLDRCLYHNRSNPTSQSRNYVQNMWERTKKLILDMRRYAYTYEEYDLKPLMDMCTFYFFTMIVRNEMRLKNKKGQLQNLQKMLDDSLCKEVMGCISSKGMNKEYRGIYDTIQSGDAHKLVRFMKRLYFKKNRLYPFLGKVISLPGIRSVYKKLRSK